MKVRARKHNALVELKLASLRQIFARTGNARGCRGGRRLGIAGAGDATDSDRIGHSGRSHFSLISRRQPAAGRTYTTAGISVGGRDGG